MTDLTLANPKLKNYLSGKSTAIPTEEIKALFTHTQKKGTFLETLDIELTKGTHNAMSLGVRPKESYMADQLLLIASADIVRREGKPESDWVLVAAKAMLNLWQHAKKLNALVQR